MLTKRKRKPGRGPAGARFAVVASEYNLKYVDAMLGAALEVLEAAGAKPVQVVRVPGAFEIPVVAASLASRGADAPEAILCLGVILRGATTHAQHIGEAVSSALAGIQVRYCVPIIHEVLLLENEDQARQRCLDRRHNRGAEAAQTALTMAGVMRALNGGSISKITASQKAG